MAIGANDPRQLALAMTTSARMPPETGGRDRGVSPLRSETRDRSRSHSGESFELTSDSPEKHPQRPNPPVRKAGRKRQAASGAARASSQPGTQRTRMRGMVKPPNLDVTGGLMLNVHEQFAPVDASP